MTARLLIIPLLLAGFLVSAHAQDSSAVTVRFAAQALPPEMPEVVMILGETVTAPFRISTQRLTEPLKAPGRVFALSAEGADKEFATVKLPEKGSGFVVLLVTGKDRKAEVIVIPDNRSKFKGGDVYAYNSTEASLLGLLGSARFTLTPGEAKFVRPTGLVEDRYYEVRFAKREGDGTKMFSSTRWPAAPKERFYVFFYTVPEKPDRIDYRVIGEVLFPPEEAP